MTAKNIKSQSIAGDKYFTPKWVVRQCLDHVIPKICFEPPTTILEPGAGQGVFVDLCRERFPESVIHAFDIDPTHAPWEKADTSLVADFLTEEGMDQIKAMRTGCYDLVVGNPPYTYAREFIERGLELGYRLVFIVRQGFLSTQARYGFFQIHKPTHIFNLCNRPQFIAGKGHGDTADYAFVCFRRRFGEDPLGKTEWHLLPPVSLAERKLG